MKSIIVVLLIFLSINTYAQWYVDSYHVGNINDLTKDQLLTAESEALTTINAGRAFTIVGFGILAGGVILYTNGMYIEPSYGTRITVPPEQSRYFMQGGAILALIGIPIWIAGDSKKKDIDVAMMRFNIGMNNIGMKITF